MKAHTNLQQWEMPLEAILISMPYVVVGGIGLLLFVLAIFADIDFFELDSASFSLMGLAAGVLAFGATGVFTSSFLHTSTAVTLVCATIAAIALILAVGFLLAKFKKSTEPAENRSYVGAVAVVRTDVTREGGQVDLESAGQMGPRLAYSTSDDPIPTGTQVIVTKDNGGSVVVEPLTK